MKSQHSHINQLLKRCKNNDSSAQFAVYNLYYKAMFNTAFRIVNNHFDAEDLMQDAFLTAFSQLNSFKNEATFGAWLKRIVINKSINHLQKLQKVTWVSLETIKEPLFEPQQNFNGVNAKEILEIVTKLPANYKVVFTLYFIEGYDYEEIAQILNISYQNSRVIVSRAKKKFQYLYNESSFKKEL